MQPSPIGGSRSPLGVDGLPVVEIEDALVLIMAVKTPATAACSTLSG
jgi:hypothetical protein